VQSQNAADFSLFHLSLLQDFEDVKSDLRTSHKLIGVLHAKISEDVAGSDLASN
jgi:hypothetical protein